MVFLIFFWLVRDSNGFINKNDFFNVCALLKNRNIIKSMVFSKRQEDMEVKNLFLSHGQMASVHTIKRYIY